MTVCPKGSQNPRPVSQKNRKTKTYKKNSFEFVAGYVFPKDVWFITPQKKVQYLPKS
jgi:hypothetical protein